MSIDNMDQTSRQKILAVFDALGDIERQEPTQAERDAWAARKHGGKASLQFRCGWCRASLASGPTHDPSCPIGQMLKIIVPLLPGFPERENWIAQGEYAKRNAATTQEQK